MIWSHLVVGVGFKPTRKIEIKHRDTEFAEIFPLFALCLCS